MLFSLSIYVKDKIVLKQTVLNFIHEVVDCSRNFLKWTYAFGHITYSYMCSYVCYMKFNKNFDYDSDDFDEIVVYFTINVNLENW